MVEESNLLTAFFFGGGGGRLNRNLGKSEALILCFSGWLSMNGEVHCVHFVVNTYS